MPPESCLERSTGRRCCAKATCSSAPAAPRSGCSIRTALARASPSPTVVSVGSIQCARGARRPRLALRRRHACAGSGSGAHRGPARARRQGGRGDSRQYISPASLTRTERDSACDGSVEDCTAWAFDERGNLTRIDDGCDGTPDICNTFTYDANGILIRSEEGIACNGASGDDCVTTIYDPDAKESTTQQDVRCDGVPDDCSSTSYEPDGRESTRLDFSCDGKSDDQCYTPIRDADGNTTGQENDRNCDGILDSCERWILVDEKEPWTPIQQPDADCDGNTDVCNTIIRDMNDNLTAFREDADCDGTPERCQEATYDANGALSAFSDGACGFAWGGDCRTTSYDATGKPTSVEYDRNCDGRVDACETSIYAP